MCKIRVLVVDDSALMRKLLSSLLNADPQIDVVGTAMDAFIARKKIKALNPDVITLDLEMPKMDGIQFLGNLMRLRPMPVVVISTLTTKSADLTLRALDLGAVSFVTKPKIDFEHSLENYSVEICNKVREAAAASIVALTSGSPGPLCGSKESKLNYRTTDQVIAIGASTGGTEAIKNVLLGMRPDCPGIVIAQHIPSLYSRSFAKRMNKVTRLAVCEAADGQLILPGHAYVAPGDRHLEVVRDGAKYRCRVSNGVRVNLHKPSVDVLFDSAAKNVGRNAIGVLLTGMGKDGANGLKRMKDAEAATIAQDEQSSVVWGMPRAAIDIGGVDKVLPLQDIAAKVTTLTERRVAKLSVAQVPD